jgi:uncharacterized protein (TIGR02246 family)
MAMTDEEQITALIQNWAAAVHTGDLAAVLADHSPDIVMFDVPPPEQGVRGLVEYRETWPPFFQWQASGAVFELLSIEVTAGSDVAFAVALLRCGTADEFERHPEARLRLTVGLRKVDGRWQVTHEHHSFTEKSAAAEASEAEIRSLHQGWFEGTARGDLDALMANIAPDVVSYEQSGELQVVGVDGVRERCRAGLKSSSGDIEFDIPDLAVRVSGDLAVAWGLDRIVADGEKSVSRGTRIFTKRGGEWFMIHQHISFPVAED